MSDSEGNPLSRSDSEKPPEEIAKEKMEDMCAMNADPDSSSEDLDGETIPKNPAATDSENAFAPPGEVVIQTPFGAGRSSRNGFSSKESSSTSKSSESTESDSDSVTSVLSGKKECDVEELCTRVASKRPLVCDAQHPPQAWQDMVDEQGGAALLREIYNCRCVARDSVLAIPVLTNRKLGRVHLQETNCTEGGNSGDRRDQDVALPVRLLPRVYPEGCCNQVRVHWGNQAQENLFAAGDTEGNVIVVKYPSRSSLAALLKSAPDQCVAPPQAVTALWPKRGDDLIWDRIITKEVVANTSASTDDESSRAATERWSRILSNDKTFVVQGPFANNEEHRLVSVVPAGRSVYPPNPTQTMLSKVGRFVVFCGDRTHCQLEPLVASRHCLLQSNTSRQSKQKTHASYAHVVAASHWVDKDAETNYWQVERAAGPERMPFAAKVCNNMAPVYEQWREQDGRSLRVLDTKAWLDQAALDTRNSGMVTAMAKYPLLNLWSVQVECSTSAVLLADASAPLLSGLALPPRVLWVLISQCCGEDNVLEFSGRLLGCIFKDLVAESSSPIVDVKAAWDESSMLRVQPGQPTEPEYRWWKRVYLDALSHAIAGTTPPLEAYAAPPPDNPTSLAALVSVINARPMHAMHVTGLPKKQGLHGGDATELQTRGLINSDITHPSSATPGAVPLGRKRKSDKWLNEMRRLIKDETLVCTDRLLQQAVSPPCEGGLEVTYTINVEINGGGASDSYKRVIRRKLQ